MTGSPQSRPNGCLLITQSRACCLSSDDQEDAPASASGGKRSKKNGSGGAVKAFLDEWSEAATEWQPEPEVVTAMEALHSAVKERTWLEMGLELTQESLRLMTRCCDWL